MTVKEFIKDKRIRFLLVGGINTAVGYGAYALFVAIGINYLVANVLSTIIGIINSYLWNKFFTFRVPRRSLTEIVRFVLVYAVSFGLNMGCLALLVGVGGVDKYLAGAITLIITTIISYLGHNYFSFGKRFVKRGTEEEPRNKEADPDGSNEKNANSGQKDTPPLREQR